MIYKLPENCQFEFLKNNIVENLDSDYLMVNHPYPIIEGEMLIY